jgi:hypothetical protein
MNMKFYGMLATLIFLSACSRVSHEKFPGGKGKTTGFGDAAVTQAVLGGLDPLNNPLAGSDERVAARSTGARIAGTVRLAQGLQRKEGMSLFIAARPLAGGPPIAVKRLGAVEFPYAFELTEENKMMAGTNFAGDVYLTIRLDQDGNPLSRQAGDMGVAVETKVGETKLDLTLTLEDN